MNQTLKRFRKLSATEFVEDATAFCFGYVWTDTYGLQRRVIYTSSVDDLAAETTNAVSVHQLLDPQDGNWKATIDIVSTASQDYYLHAQTGVFEPEPFKEDGTVKSGLMRQFEWLFNVQFQLFEGLTKDIQVRKFNATSFD